MFLAWQRYSNHPLIEPKLWLNPLFCRGPGMQSLVFLALASHSFSTPFYLDVVLGLSPQKSGLAMALFPIGIMLASPVAKLLLTGAPRIKQGTITGIFHTTNNLSLVIGVSFASLILHLGQEAAGAKLTAGLPGEPFLPLYLFNISCFAAAAFMALKIKPSNQKSPNL